MRRTPFWLSGARLTGGLAIAGILFAASPVLANGGDFFEEFASTLDHPNPNAGSPFFGFVRDQRGKALPRAMVTATIGTTGESLTILADALGHYRIPGFDKSIDAKTVDIGCSKFGYRQTVAARRIQKGAPNAPVEVDCTLAPVVD